MKDTLGATNKSVNKSLAESKGTLLKGIFINFVIFIEFYVCCLVRDDLEEVKGELRCQAEVIRELQTALKEQNKMAAEQQRVFVEMW